MREVFFPFSKQLEQKKIAFQSFELLCVLS